MVHKEKSVGNYDVCVNGSGWAFISISTQFNENLTIRVSKRYETEGLALYDFNALTTTAKVEQFLRARAGLYAKFKKCE